MAQGSCPVIEDDKVCGRVIRARGYCSKHYRRARKYGDPLISGNARGKPMADRFWPFVSVGDSEECWPWTGGVYSHDWPYGRLRWNGRPIGAHRASWILAYGPIPEGLFVLHHCDNPRCVNPAHLFLGTPCDNMIDKTAKGRAIGGSRPMVRETNPNARLTSTNVDAIRIAYSAGDISQSDLARMFGVSQVQISRIVRQIQWLDA